MKAVVFREVEVIEVELDPPGPGEVKVKIAAGGVCHSDLHLIRGEWGHPLPVVLGHEGSGTIVEVGGGVLPDGTTRVHVDGERAFHYLGVSSFAEYAVVPAAGAIKIRDDAPLDSVALIGCAVATGVCAVRNTAEVEPGSTVAVIGCGGVGLNVVQGALLAGASRIIGSNYGGVRPAIDIPLLADLQNGLALRALLIP